jgi:hypothetical protein
MMEKLYVKLNFIKILLLFLLFNLLSEDSNGQDTIRRYELGIPIITANYFVKTNYSTDRPVVEYFNGLFFRTTKKRFGIRAHLNYKAIERLNDDLRIDIDHSAGISHTYKDFRIGFGGQFSISRKKDFFYTFIDLLYRNLKSSGSYIGSLNGGGDLYSFNSNSLFSSIGLAFKFKLFKIFYLSPEFGYNLIGSSFKNTRTNVISGMSNSYTYFDFTMNPFAVLNLTVKF